LHAKSKVVPLVGVNNEKAMAIDANRAKNASNANLFSLDKNHSPLIKMLQYYGINWYLKIEENQKAPQNC